nr:hypothetical protein [uncultured Anaerosporobacter sp.]
MRNKKITKSKYTLSAAEQKACHVIIHTASVSAAGVGAGLAQIPLADNAVITPIQITMIVSLGKVFEQEITKSIAKGLLGGFIGNFVGRGVAQAAWGWVPGIGNASNAITAAAITESIGWLCVDHFYKERYLKDKTPKEEFDFSKSNVNEETKEDSTIKEETKENLKERAYEFINGEKTRTDNKKEYMSLLDAFDEKLADLPENDELYEIYRELMKVK